MGKTVGTRVSVTFGEEKPYVALYICRKCHEPHDALARRCPSCGGHYTLRAQRKVADLADAQPIVATSSTAAVAADPPRTSTGIESVDTVFGGGGIVDGSVNMCWGLGGSGKSTLLVQIAACAAFGPALLAQSEQPESVVMSTIARLGAKRPGFDVVATADPEAAMRVMEAKRYRLVVVDSLQDYAEGGRNIGKLQRVGRGFTALARRIGATMLIVSHSIGTGKQAGGEANVHGVDATFEVTGDLSDEHGARFFRVLKNRFGGSGRTARFKMSDHGLVPWPEETREAKAKRLASGPEKDNSFNRRAKPKRPVAR